VNFLLLHLKYFLIWSLLILLSDFNYAQTGGTIRGKVIDNSTGEVLPFVNVTISESLLGAATDETGFFIVNNLPGGNYTLLISAVGYKTQRENVIVVPNQTTDLSFSLIPSAVEFGDVLVYGASLRRERITEAPASISVLELEEIKRNAGHGQLPRLLENQPGIDIAQSGIFDFNINTRGFNSSLNRRLLILLDGRDLGTAFLGATEWNGLSTPLEDLGRIELVRGPGSALYGANAYNGVVNITSIPPKNISGTRLALSAGEMNTFKGDIRNAGAARNWSYKINIGGYQGESFSRSRVGQNFEYPGLSVLNDELVAPDPSPVRTIYGAARLDYEFNDGGIATVEGGLAQVENEVIVTGIGRVQVRKANRPWGRINYNGHGFNILGWTNSRINVEPEVSLSTGLDLIQNANITHGEIQYNFNEFQEKLFVVAGISHRIVSIDTENTLMENSRNDNSSGVFAQIEYKFLNNLKLVAAARWDRNSLHPSQFSPKAAAVWSFLADHTLRATFNKAFQPPNYSEQYLYVFHPVRNVAYFGNPDLVPERITGYEIGYKGAFSKQLFITTDFYFNQLEEFITDLGPGLNPKYPAPIYFPPPDDRARTIWSYTNAGKVEEWGVEFGANYYLSDSWIIHSNFTYFSFEVVERHPNDILLPNTPDFKVNGGVTYIHPAGHSVEINFKYIPSFPWAAGIFRDSEIPAYTLLNLAGTYIYSNLLSFNLNVSNILDNKHYEILGGSLLGRRAIITAIVNF
jgi:outer membrane receptor for ferrienterochelin and colicins